MSKNSLLEKVGQQDHKHRRREKKSKAFEDISKYFSEKQWKNMLYSEKTTCVYLKRNYEIMSGIENQSKAVSKGKQKKTVRLQVEEMIPRKSKKEVNDRKPAYSKKIGPPGKDCDSDQKGHRRGRNTSCAYSLRERKYVVAYEEISDPEEDEEEEEEEEEEMEKKKKEEENKD